MAEFPRRLAGVADLVPLFDNLIIDQFGVLHDGSQPYPGSVETLVRLKQTGKQVLLLSNSGKRSAPNEQRLLDLGFKAGSWDYFLSSGEVAWRQLAAELQPGERMRCLLLSRGGDRSAVENLPLNIVEDASEADIVLLSGSEGDRYDLDHYRRLLEPAARRGLRCLCTNPDKIMLTAAGKRFGAGAIAETYEEMGGPVSWIGKPFPAIYDGARALLGDPPRERTACIGDSVEHDIAGGQGAGMPTILVATGILEDVSDAVRTELFQRHGAAPDYLLSAFSW